jgi:predicted dehydrogenase
MVRVAVIGAGHWGPNLIANFHDRIRSEVAWVVDRDPARREAVELRFPDVQVTEDAGAAIGDPTVDAVVVATPTGSHFELAKSALEAGKHVLVEKPMADNVRDAEALCEIAERCGQILMVGHVFVFNPASQQAKRYLLDGDLGRIYYVSMTRTNLGPFESM